MSKSNFEIIQEMFRLRHEAEEISPRRLELAGRLGRLTAELTFYRSQSPRDYMDLHDHYDQQITFVK